MTLDSDLLRSFLAVAETGAVTHAAARVGRTQSAVSIQIRKLEETLGQTLFDRHPRGVTLTARGAQLLPYAEQVVRMLDDAAVALRERPLNGPLRIGIPDEYGTTILPRVLADFSTRHPEVEVTVRQDYTVNQITLLRKDELDLAVVFEQEEPTEGEVLCVDPTVWATSTAHQLHTRRPVPIAAYFRSTWGKQLALGSLDRHGVAYRVAFECDTSSGLRAAVRAGLAVSPVSRSAIPEGCRELTREDGFPAIDDSRVVLRRNPRGARPATEALAGMLREAFQPLAGAVE